MRARWLPGRDGFGREVPRWLYTRYEPAHWYPDYPESESDDDDDDDDDDEDEGDTYTLWNSKTGVQNCQSILQCVFVPML